MGGQAKKVVVDMSSGSKLRRKTPSGSAMMVEFVWVALEE